MNYEILKDRDLILIDGSDNLKFLQSLTTNDIGVEGQLVYSYLLSPQGRYLFDFFTYYDGIKIWLDIASADSAALQKRLNMYKMRSDVQVTSLSDTRVIYSDAVLDNVISYQDPRFSALGYRSFVERSSKVSGDLAEGLYIKHKYEHIIPDGVSEMTKDKSFPQEFGAEELNAISFTKGCYVGQEVISRTKYQGVVRKKLFKLDVESAEQFLEQDAVIYQNNNRIGKICSHFGNIAIAQIRTNLYDNSTQNITVGEGCHANVSLAKWYK